MVVELILLNLQESLYLVLSTFSYLRNLCNAVFFQSLFQNISRLEISLNI